jgi:oligopeptide/dipeptide ABC transporter ATP-binding protein
MATSENMLVVRNLKVVFPGPGGILRAVEGVDLDVRRGECVALVGESGCGKSVTALAIMKLLSTPPAIVRVDELRLDGEELKDLSDTKMQDVRGRHLAMIFQDAMTALNPVMTVGKQLDEIYIRHQRMTSREARIQSIRALELVGVPEPARRADCFPHQLSGGMRQRVMIAMAFACMPKLIIADEPTTALDVTIQAQVLDVLNDMQKKHAVSQLLITHDLSVVANTADTVYVMYCGKIVEKAPVLDLFRRPLHPYTVGLLASVPKLGDERRKFVQIPDCVPHPMHKPAGCYFHTRCTHATDRCRAAMPPISARPDGHLIRCWHPLDGQGGQES